MLLPVLFTYCLHTSYVMCVLHVTREFLFSLQTEIYIYSFGQKIFFSVDHGFH